tara:strand:+ start:1445 stop:3160 length:1716 start_codon:yes stop_codon:yes gene_type:complete
MAIEDYFKGSSQAYGQLAGSLLAGRRKEDKKEAKRALLASTVMATFGALQNQQKQSIIDGSNDVKDKYQDIFDNNEEIYNKKRGARADYLAYKENPNDYIETKAAELFNKDLELQAELGTNPYSRISKADLTPESYESAMEVLDDKRKIAKEYIEAQAGNAAVTTQTFTKFNAAAKEEYEAAMAEVEDDPYKQGLIRSAFSKIFGTGEEKKNKLLTDLQTAKTKRMQQESTIPYMDTVKGKEELINKQIKTGEEKASKDSFMYETKTMKLEKQEKEIIKSIEEARTKNILAGSKEEKELEDNVISAYRKGLKVSKIKELDEIQENDIPAFVSTFTKVDRIREDAPDMDPTDFLTVKERDLYDLGMGITRDDINAVEEIRNTENRLEVVSQINSIIGQETDVSKKLSMIDGNFGTNGEDATGLSSVYISNVIRAKTHLMNKYDMDDIEALQTAMDMQLEGVSIGKGGSTTDDEYNRGGFRRLFTSQKPTHGIEYVNPDVENLPIIPDTANLHAQNLNEYKYLQNRKYIDDEGNSQTLIPDRVGKEYTIDDEDFTVSFIVNNENKWIPLVTYK